MSKLAAVAERLAETRRWLDQEADRLAARLDQLERRAPAAIQTAHRLLDEQQRGLEETERMVQQWLSATADLANAAKGAPRTLLQARQYRSRQNPQESIAAAPDAVNVMLDEQQKYVGKLERALQTLASAPPEPLAEAASPLEQSGEDEPALDSRQLLDEQQKTVRPRDEGGLERALQTLANMPRPRLTPFVSEAPTPAESALRVLDEPQKAEDASKQQPRKLGVVRVA